MANTMFCSKIVHFLVIHLASCEAARILGIAPFESSSHNIIMTSLFKELAKRGHEMTVLTVKPLKEVPANYTQMPIIYHHAHSDDGYNLFDLGGMNPLVLMMFMWSLGNTEVDTLLQNPSVQKLLQSSNEKFDLIIMEKFFNEALVGFSHKFNAPYVSVTTFSATEDFRDAVGDPFPYSYVPNPFLTYSDHMTFFQRLENTVINFVSKLGYYFYFLPAQDAIMRKHFKDVPNLPPLADIVQNTSLLLMNTHFSVSFPKPKAPSLIEIGGFHIKPPKKLPQDIQTFLDNAKDGVIYFSMGSNLQSSDMSVSKREAFLKAFAKLKQKVLWKFEENLPGAPENVHISKWFPQSDILGHPHLRVFMTHGGLLSSYEAMYNAVPLVGIPIFADQVCNVKRAADTGYALHLDFKNITEESVYWTLNEVVNNPKYKLAAKSVSKLYHDQPQTPMERTMFWIEYVIRHKGAHHLRSAALDLTWYQYYLLDVIAVLLALCFAVVVLLIWLLRALARVLLQKLQKRPSNVHKKRD